VRPPPVDSRVTITAADGTVRILTVEEFRAERAAQAQFCEIHIAARIGATIGCRACAAKRRRYQIAQRELRVRSGEYITDPRR
jgi:hypothetical protein